MKNSDMDELVELLEWNWKWELIWLQDIGTGKAGEVAGSEVGRGYRQIKYKGKRHAAHRLSFYKANGYLPEQVDHIDGNTSNNNPDNLRPATASQNMINRKLQKNNKIGRVGVDFMKREKRFRAQIHKDGNKIYLGMFDNLLDAVAARIRAEKKYHGEYTRR